MPLHVHVAKPSPDRVGGGRSTSPAQGGSAAADRVHILADMANGSAIQRARAGSVAQLAVASRNRTGLPDALKVGIEGLSGLSMEDVRVHRHSAMPGRIGAHAFARGSDIHLATGQERHLPHEAWHVVQQMQGRVPVTRRIGDLPINDNPALENEATRMGNAAATLRPAVSAQPAPGSASAIGPVQRAIIQDEGSDAGKTLASRGEQLDQLSRRAQRDTFEPLHVLLALKQSGDNASPPVTLTAALDAAAASQHGALPLDNQSSTLSNLYRNVALRLQNYGAWLFNDQYWQTRDDTARKYLTDAQVEWTAAFDQFANLTTDYPQQTALPSRHPTIADVTRDDAIRTGIIVIDEHLQRIDDLVKNPPPPTKVWTSFQGSDDFVYATGTQSDPIPVVFYKSEADYRPITVPRNDYGVTSKTYQFPNGPKGLPGRKGTYDLTVDAGFRYDVGTVLKNSKDDNDRSTQVDINVALKRVGVAMDGFDGDHVRDLGFGGKDRADNYWPLKAEINRRPFLGWRAQYGLNYEVDDGGTSTGKTASVGTLLGKYFRIASFMNPSDGNVPEVGKAPDPSSGGTPKSTPSRRSSSSQRKSTSQRKSMSQRKSIKAVAAMSMQTHKRRQANSQNGKVKKDALLAKRRKM